MAKFFRFSGLFTRNLEKQARTIALSQALDIGTAQLELLKEKLLDAVRLHPISQELSSLTLPSKFVKSKSGTATLYGYLGFPSGSNPTEDLISFLEDTVKVNSRRKYFVVGKKIITSLSIPTKGDMNGDDRLKLPWSSIGWPILLENGVSGLAGGSHFLQKPADASRSELGIQIKGITRPDLAPIPFLSQIFKDFREKFGSN